MDMVGDEKNPAGNRTSVADWLIYFGLKEVKSLQNLSLLILVEGNLNLGSK